MAIGGNWLVIGIGATVGVVALIVARTVGRANRPTLPECSAEYTARNKGGTRPMDHVRLIVLHSTEGGTAKSNAQWFQTGEGLDGKGNKIVAGSTHIVVDETSCYRTLPDNVIPHGAAGGRANEDGLHIEMVGFAKWSRAEWLSKTKTLDKAAAWIAEWANEYKIPLRFLTAADLKRDGLKARGVTTHAAITEAFKPGGHTDPGKQFPIDVVMRAAGGSASIS